MEAGDVVAREVEEISAVLADVWDKDTSHYENGTGWVDRRIYWVEESDGRAREGAGALGGNVRFDHSAELLQWRETSWPAQQRQGHGACLYVPVTDASSSGHITRQFASLLRHAFEVRMRQGSASKHQVDENDLTKRTVRIVEIDSCLWEKHGANLPPPWSELRKEEVIEARLRPLSFRWARGFDACDMELTATGVTADLLLYLGHGMDGVTVVSKPPFNVRRMLCQGPNGVRNGAVLVLAALDWWRRAEARDAFDLLDWMQLNLPAQLMALAAEHPQRDVLGKESLVTSFLNQRIQGLEGLKGIFGHTLDGEEEIGGWAAALDAVVREAQANAGGLWAETSQSPALSEVPSNVEEAVVPQVPKLAWHIPHVSTALLSLQWQKGSDESPLGRNYYRWGNAPQGCLDGRATLIETARSIQMNSGQSFSSALDSVISGVQQGKLIPLYGGGASGTLSDGPDVYYFAYGSCMCRPSFRETIPQHQWVGPARLADYRLGFTLESEVRKGGVADVVEAPGSEVWGILYRVPRTHLDLLDAREGVHVGQYARHWISVEFCGVLFTPVLTYTVVNKASEDIAPSEEYAGLILDGACGLLPRNYVRKLLERFEEMGVEAVAPFS